MKRRLNLYVGMLAAAMLLIFNSNVWAQGKATTPGPVQVSAGGPAPAQSTQKHLTREEFAQLEGDGQAVVLANLNSYVISDLVNATPADLATRKSDVFYVPVADFLTYPTERQWLILKNPTTYIVVQDAASIPKIEISKAEYDALSTEKKINVRNSSEYIIIN